jgi:lysophospholipase L1-like esterase
MSRPLLAAAVLAVGLVALPAAPVTPSHAVQRSPGALTWLALGDSYSAGEGLENNDIAANPGDMTLSNGEFVKAHNCERATGTSTTQPASRAWSVIARDLLANQGKLSFASFSLKACTGAITNEWRKQWEEAGSVTSDLITLSMGGNNIGFRDTVMACAGISVEGGIDATIGDIAAGLPGAIAVWALNPALGCNTTEDELRHRVDQLVGKDTNAPHTAFNSSQTLPDMYREIAQNAVTPGGHVLVLGYPNLLEESGKWTWRLLSGNRCHRIRRADANMFRRVLGYLNEQTALAAQAADGKYNGVHFDWLDVSKVYENDTTGHHGLCTGEPWLNGLTFGADGPDAGLIGFRIFRSFHPNQLGYAATGQAVADRIAGYDWSTLQQPAAGPPDIGSGPACTAQAIGFDTGTTLYAGGPTCAGDWATGIIVDYPADADMDFLTVEVFHFENRLWRDRGEYFIDRNCNDGLLTSGMPRDVAEQLSPGDFCLLPPVDTFHDEPATGPLRPGDHGERVRALQVALQRLADPALTIDGYFGIDTEIAVMVIQGANGLTRDGVAGPATFAMLGVAYR